MAVLAVYENHLVNDAGTPIVGATVNAYRVDTGALAATTTTQGATAGPPAKRAGRWVIGPLEDTLEYYIEAIVGTEKVVMGRWSGEMGTLRVFDRAILPTNTTINGATPITSANIASQSVSAAVNATNATNATNSAQLGGIAAASYSQTSHNHNASYSLLAHDHNASYSLLGHNHAGVYAAAAHSHEAGYGSYTGNGTSNRTITVGFTPKMVFLSTASFRWTLFHAPGIAITTTLFNLGGGTVSDYTSIVQIVTNAFVVAIPGAVGEASGNNNGSAYSWVAIP